MEINANRVVAQHGRNSFFFPKETKKEGRIHVGYVCDADAEYSARIALFSMALIRQRGQGSKQLIQELFKG